MVSTAVFFKDSVNLRQTNPTKTANHKVNSLDAIANAIDVESEMPCNENKPAKLPSVTPNPPGTKETFPTIIESEYALLFSYNLVHQYQNLITQNRLQMTQSPYMISLKVKRS